MTNMITELTSRLSNQDTRKKDAQEYITAGNATFTVKSSKWQKYYTYKFVHKKNDKCKERYMIYLLYGPDNTANYRYFGLFYADTQTLRLSENTYTDPAVMLRAFIKILYTESQVWPTTCHFYKSGKCACCGRKLTTPESIERGIGPECYEKLNSHNIDN